MTDNRNTILAVILSGLVLIGWQYFYNMPQMERQRAQTQMQAELAKPTDLPAEDAEEQCVDAESPRIAVGSRTGAVFRRSSLACLLPVSSGSASLAEP